MKADGADWAWQEDFGEGLWQLASCCSITLSGASEPQTDVYTVDLLDQPTMAWVR